VCTARPLAVIVFESEQSGAPTFRLDLGPLRLPLRTGPIEQVTHFPESGLFLEEPSMAPDGSFLVYSRSNGGSSLWLLALAAESSAK